MRLKNGRAVFTLVLILLAAVMSASGCEPLRKKFTRQKKTTQSQEVQPVLEPIDYPDKVVDSASLLRHHYGLWGVWYGEATRDLLEKSSDKRVTYDLNQLQDQLTELQKLFNADSQKALEGYAVRLGKIQAKFAKGEALRNTSGIEKDLRILDKDFRGRFRPEVAQGLLPK